MDDLNLRRKIIADPNSLSAAEQAELQSDPIQKALLDEMHNLDAKFLSALNDVKVPEGLQERLILKQSIVDFKQTERRKNRWSIGIAASVAFACAMGISTWLFQPVNTSQVAQYALDHVYHEASYINNINEAVSLQQVNAKLSQFGGQLLADVGQVTYANFCELNGLKSLHLVMQGQHGKVTVFVLPKENELADWQNFSDKIYAGTAKQYPAADMIVIGEHGENLAGFQQTLEQNISWSI